MAHLPVTRLTSKGIFKPSIPAAEGGPGLAESVPGGWATLGVVGGGLLLLAGALIGVQMYAGQKVGRAMKRFPGDPGSSWGWLWAGLGGPVGAGLLGFKRSGETMDERVEFLKGAAKGGAW
jgi:hypothetical protein